MRTIAHVKLIVLLAAILGVLTLAIGCTADQLAQVQQTRAATTQAVADLEAQAATLPPGDPVRVEIEKTVSKAKDSVAKLDAAVAGIANGDLSEIRKQTEGIPYSGIAISVASLVYGLYQRGQLGKIKTAFTQVVKSVDHALPEPTEAQKLAMSAVQDDATRKLVDEVKG